MKKQDDKVERITFYYLLRTALKGISQVTLLENVVSGSIILVAITIANYQLGIIALLSAIIGTLVAGVTGGSKDIVDEGLFGYNSVLVGLALYLFLVGNFRFVIALLGAAFVAIFTSAMMYFFKKLEIPVLTFPYIILTWFLLLSSYHLKAFKLSSELVPQDLTHWQLNIQGPLNIIGGLFNGIGQIYFQAKFLPSVLILLAIFWDNRKLGIYTAVGTIVSWVTAYFLGAEHSNLNLGTYGYNAVLTILAVSGVFERGKRLSLVTIIIAAMVTVPITAGMDTLLSPYGLPVLTMPFVIVTWIFVVARKVLYKL